MHIQPLDHTQDFRIAAARHRLQVVSRSACCEVRHYYGGVSSSSPPPKNFGGRDLDPGRITTYQAGGSSSACSCLAHAFGEGVAAETNTGTSAPSCSPAPGVALVTARCPKGGSARSAWSPRRTASPIPPPIGGTLARDVGAERATGVRLQQAGGAHHQVRGLGYAGHLVAAVDRAVRAYGEVDRVAPVEQAETRSAAGGSRRRGGRRRGGRG